MLLIFRGHNGDICNVRKREESEGCILEILCILLDLCGTAIERERERGGRRARVEGKRIGCEVCEECGLVSTGIGKTKYV